MLARLPGRRLLLLLLGSLMALLLVLASHPRPEHTGPDPALAMGVVAGQVLPVPPGLRAPHRLRLALRLEDLSALELSSKTFRVEGQVLLEWDGDLQQRLEAEAIDTGPMLRFVNLVEGWNSTYTAVAPARANRDRTRFSQSFRFEGKFYVNDFDLRRAPFLRISLPLIVEVADERLALESGGVLLELPRDVRGLTGGGVSMAGFRFAGTSVESALHRTVNPFEPAMGETFSRAVLRLDYRTDDLAAALRWILPLLLVMAVVLLAPSLDSARDELSFGLPSAGLLTLVVLQEGYRSQVPATPYLTFLDQLYAYSFAVAVAVFLLFVWGGNLRAATPPAQHDAVAQRINRVCRRSQLSALLGYAVIVCWNLL